MIEERIRNVYVDVEDMTYQGICIENLTDGTFEAYFHDTNMNIIFKADGWLDDKERNCTEEALKYYRDNNPYS